MGKGKRNRQFHFEDKQTNPEKYKEPKKPFRMPKWATYTIWSALLIIVVGAIVLTSLFDNGVFLRNRILVNSQGQDDTYDMNQQMATFIVWQNMYQQAYTEFTYTQYGLYEDTYDIVDTYGSAMNYAVSMANYYSTEMLRDGIDIVADYLAEMVAGADAAVKMGLTLNEDDQTSIEDLVNWVKNIHTQYAGSYPFENFLNVFVAQGVKESDIRKAAGLMAMYTKYCDYKKLELDNDIGENDENKLLDYIAKNPSGHYEAVYRMYQVNDKDFADKLLEAKTAEEFTAMVVDRIMEVNFDTLAFNKFTLPRADEAEALILKALEDKGDATLTDDDLDAANAKALELGLTEVSYQKVSATTDGKTTSTYTPELNDTLAKFIFASARKAGNVDVLTNGTTAYLVYIYETNNAEANPSDTMIVKAGIKEFKISDDSASYESFRESLVKDLNSEDRKNTTDNKSAEELAKEFYDQLKEDKTVAFPEGAQTNSYSTPGENDTTDAIQDYLYDEDNDIKKDGVYQIDDNGTTYVVLVTDVDDTDEDDIQYSVKYATYTDSDYYYFFRNLKSNLDSSYASTAPTLTHPEATTKDTFEEWMCEADVVEATETEISKRTFKRVANETKYFESKNDSDEVTGYNVYMVVEPMTLTKSDEATVYGGYLKFQTEADANAALDKLKDKTGFELWHAFIALTSTTKDSEGKETVNSATLETNIKKSAVSDEAVQKWLFDEARKMDDVAVVKVSDTSYYVTYFKSAEQEWTRTARDEWVASEMTEILETLVSEGGYKLDENVLNKIGEPTTTAETTAGDTTEDTTAGEETTAA